MSELFSEYWPVLKEVRGLAEKFRRYRPTTIREVLSCWADRRPVEAPLPMIEDLFVGIRSMRETMKLILSYLRDRDWRGAIVRVVGEYGSGKTQMGRLLLRAIREEGEAEPRFVTLDPLTDVRDLLVDEVDAEGPVVLIVDEVDQLLRDLERGRREKLEDLADVIRWVTEGSYSRPARGSVILLLSKRAQEALMSDRALANRLMERSRVFRLSMPDEERMKAGVEAVKKILALQMAYSTDRAFLIERIFPALYPLMKSYAENLALTREIGGIVKNLVEISEEVLEGVREDASLPSRTEEGVIVESIIREFFSREMRSIPFRVRLGDDVLDYLAIFSDERIRTGNAVSDGQFLVWTYDPSTGRRGERLVEVEIKFGDSWMGSRDQIMRLSEAHPLLLIAVTDTDPEVLSEVEAEVRRGGRSFSILPVDPHLIRVAHLMREERALPFLRERGNFERDLPEVLSQLLVPSSVAQTSGDSGVDRDALLRKASSVVLSSLIRELRGARTSKRMSTLSNVIVASVDSVFRGAGVEAPVMSPGTVEMVIRVLVREGVGRLSSTGKSLMLSKEARLVLEEVERNENRRKRVEAVIYDVLSRGMIREASLTP